jgi:small basic protein
MPKKKRKKTQESKPSERSLRRELTTQMLQLITSGFGVVAALAWNDAIQTFVKEYVEQIFPKSGLISKFIYATLITTLIVLVTYQLSTIAAKLRPKNQ